MYGRAVVMYGRAVVMYGLLEDRCNQIARLAGGLADLMNCASREVEYIILIIK